MGASFDSRLAQMKEIFFSIKVNINFFAYFTLSVFRIKGFVNFIVQHDKNDGVACKSQRMENFFYIL